MCIPDTQSNGTATEGHLPVTPPRFVAVLVVEGAVGHPANSISPPETVLYDSHGVSHGAPGESTDDDAVVAPASQAAIDIMLVCGTGNMAVSGGVMPSAPPSLMLTPGPSWLVTTIYGTCSVGPLGETFCESDWGHAGFWGGIPHEVRDIVLVHPRSRVCRRRWAPPGIHFETEAAWFQPSAGAIAAYHDVFGSHGHVEVTTSAELGRPLHSASSCHGRFQSIHDTVLAEGARCRRAPGDHRRVIHVIRTSQAPFVTHGDDGWYLAGLWAEI